MTNENQTKYNRIVKPHRRKSIKGVKSYVQSYKQSYVTPRGPVRKVKLDRLKPKSQTIWLMDKQGHFVGRANYKGDTTAADKIYKWGYDQTTNIRDARKYKRILGRKSLR